VEKKNATTSQRTLQDEVALNNSTLICNRCRKGECNIIIQSYKTLQLEIALKKNIVVCNTHGKEHKEQQLCNIAYNVVRDMGKKHTTTQPKSNASKAKKP
jgi:hypothetical protein